MKTKDKLSIRGKFFIEHIRDGKVIYKGEFHNLVTTVGKSELLDNGLDGSTGYMFLISSVDYSTIVVGDTMSSHAGWKEAGAVNAPNYSGNRKTCVWDSGASGAKALSSALNFTFSELGTVKGGGIVFGSGALATKDDTNGVLFSAALFDEGDREVITNDQINVSYEVTIS